MKYCELCRLIVDDTAYCPYCGKTLREVKEDDYCFVTEIERSQREYFQMVVGEHIPCAFLPSGNAVRTQFALPLENFKVYVPFSFYDEVSKRLNGVCEAKKDELKESIVKNLDKLFIVNPKREKKIRKKLKISLDEDSIAAISARIKDSNKIVDGGMITSCRKGGHYLFVYSGDRIITVNSATFEIIAVD